MRSLPNAYKQAILNNQKKYYVTARINLADGNTHFNLTNEELWEGSGFSIEEAVSEDGKFTALGSTIISTARLSIKNLNEEYSSYDFTGAVAIVYLGIVGINENPVLIGTYTVDECSFTDGAINLTLLDNMEMLDRPYTAAVTYPATLYTIVNAACQNAGLLFESASSSTPFPHHNLVLDDEFDSDGLTCREVVGMAAAIAGCFVKCTPAGKIKFGWFDYSTLNSWQTAYGNNTTPSQQVLSKMHYITSVFSQDISVDPVNITGVRIVYEKTVDSQRREYTVTAGSEGYVIGIEKNNLLNAYTTAQINSIRDWLGTQLIGMTFRKASVSHSSDPAIESGDVAAVWDRKGRGYPILVTRVNFTAYDLQKTVCGAETPLRNKATRYTWQSKAYQDMIKQLNEERSLRQLAEQELQQAVASAAGMYLHVETDQQSGSTIYYLHNFRDFDSSPVRIMFADTGIMMTSNGTAAQPTWYGLTTSGTMFANLIAAIQIGFDQAQGGTLTLGGNNNANGQLMVYDASGNPIGRFDKDGLSASGNLEIRNSISSTVKFNIFGGEFGYREYLWVEGYSRYVTRNGFAIERRNGSGNQVAIFGLNKDMQLNWKIPRLSGNYSQIIQGSDVEENLASIIIGDNSYDYNLTVGLGAHDLSFKYWQYYKPTTESGNANMVSGYPGLHIKIDGTRLAFESSSSRRYKHDIEYKLTGDRDPHGLLSLPVAEFVFNDDHHVQFDDMRGKTIPGLIAEDVAEKYPSAAIVNVDTGEIESWDERRIIPGMLALIQEQHETIEEQKKQLNRQQMQLNEMQSQINELRELVKAAQDRADSAYRLACI